MAIENDGHPDQYGHQVIAPGETINIATNNFQFSNYVVAKIE